MKIPQITKKVEGHAAVESTEVATLLWTDWMLAAGASELIVWFEQRACSGTGTFTSKGRWQFAAVDTNKPEDWQTGTTARTGDDQFVDVVDLSGTTDMMWVRAGFGGYESGGLAEADIAVQGQVQGKGVLVAVDVVEVQATTNSGESQYAEVGKRFPQQGLTKLMFGFTFSGVSGTITYRPLHREFKGDPDFPTAWTALGGADSTRSTDGRVSPSQLTVTPTAGYMFGQAGLRFSGNAQGKIKITVAAIY